MAVCGKFLGGLCVILQGEQTKMKCSVCVNTFSTSIILGKLDS